MADNVNRTVTLLAGGDIGPIVEPTDQFAELILPVLKQADLRFGQCERSYSERASVLAPGGLRTSRHPREASVWKTADIDVISMASNHTMDSGAGALLDTIELFHGMGKHCIGAGKDIATARKPAIVVRNEVKIAFLGYCSVLPNGHEATQEQAGCVPMRAHTYYQRGEDPIEESSPKSLFTFPADARKTMLAKAVFSKRGVERVSFLPAYINTQAQPAVVPPADPKFHEILEYMEWISDHYSHRFRVEAGELVVEQ